MMSMNLWSLEEASCEGSCSSVASLGTWCREPGIMRKSKAQLLDSFEAECPDLIDRSLLPPSGSRRTKDSFASLVGGDSSKSLHERSKKLEEKEELGWVKVDFFFIGSDVELDIMILEGQMKTLYLMEKAREEQFHARNDTPVLRKLKSPHKERDDRLGNSPFRRDDSNNHKSHQSHQNTIHDASFRALSHRGSIKQSGVKKSISMTTLVSADRCESKDAVRETMGSYNVDGMCMQHIFSKRTPDDSQSNTDFGFVRSHETSTVNVRSATTPKIKRGIHQSFKANGQAVRTAISRCCSWDGSSSVDSSSRWRLPSAFSIVKRFVCCESNFTSDDETVR